MLWISHDNELQLNTVATGVLMGAVLLGVLINKASIPSARVVFSDVCLLTSRNGEPVLILRIGNTRGNFLLNPEIRVGYLKVRSQNCLWYRLYNGVVILQS